MLDLEANYTKVRNWLDGVEIELVPIGEDGRRALSATEQTYFPALEEGWWQVRVRTAEGAEWNELVEIKEHQERTLTLR